MLVMNEKSVPLAMGVSDEKPSLTVIDRIAALEETDPVELPPLYDAIDPEALDSLVDPPATDDSRTASTVRFAYCGYDVRVRSDGEIMVEAA